MKNHTPSRPPARTRILEFLLRDSVKDGAAEDFEEHFQYLVQSRGRLEANTWYWSQLLGMLPA